MLRLQIAQEFRYGLGCKAQNPFYLLSQQGQEVKFTYLRWGSEWIRRHSLRGGKGRVWMGKLVNFHFYVLAWQGRKTVKAGGMLDTMKRFRTLWELNQIATNCKWTEKLFGIFLIGKLLGIVTTSIYYYS